MGLKFWKKAKVDEEGTQKVTTIEITDQKIQEAKAEVYLRELAFWRCVSLVSNLLGQCEIRTFANGKETFDEEYYLWNYEPNRNQNKQQFFDKATEKLFRKNEALIVESMDGQLFVADDFGVVKNTLYGNVYTDVTVDDYTFQRTFRSGDVLHLQLNNKNVNKVLQNLYQGYAKLIDYASSSFLKSRGSRGTLNISALAQSAKNFDETLKKMLNEYFRDFFSASNAVLPLFEGYTYTELGGKTYNETTSRDIKSQYDDVFDFTARAFGVPAQLAKGDVQDNSKAMDEMLTTCIDPLAGMWETEINRKRNSWKNIRDGTYHRIDTIHVKHVDMFDIAPQADKLISSGMCTINMLLRAIGEPQIAEDWADQHFITKNYSTIQDLLTSLNAGGGETGA